jgi:two-component system, OmpR family, sensor histidine kinase KdpD
MRKPHTSPVEVTFLRPMTATRPREAPEARAGRAPANAWHGFVASCLVALVATGVSSTLLDRQYLADVVMVYLLGTVLVSMRYGYGPSVAAALTSVLCFNFFFIPPYYTLSVTDLRHVVTFAVMFLVAVVISRLTKRVRDEADTARRLGDEAQRATLLAETERLRSALLSSVSHDLRTPLAVVTGAATTLLDAGVDPTAQRELLETIVHEAERLERLVRNLLDMTRLEAGSLRLRREWHSLEEVVGTALGRLDKSLGGREIRISVPPDLPLVALDPILVEQVLVNLVDNAVKYTPDGTSIELSVVARRDEVEIAVSDHGAGVPAGDERRVFEKFYRARSDGGGAGLGLAICDGIVKAHGGRIWVERRPEGGAAFRFTLPSSAEPPAVAAEV